MVAVKDLRARWLTVSQLVALLAFSSSQLSIAGETNGGSIIGLKLMAEGLNAPIGLVSIPDGSGRLLVADQAGLMHLLTRDGKKAEHPFLDLRGKIVPLGKGMEERGLLGLALHPQFKSNQKVYVVYSAPRRTSAPEKWDHTERLSEFKAAEAGLAAADLASERDDEGELYVLANGINSVAQTRGKVFKLVPQ